MSDASTSKWGHAFLSGALRRRIVRHPTRRYNGGSRAIIYPLPHYLLWRGNVTAYMYNQHQTARYGEGDAQLDYHQHFAHAKDPRDSCKAHEMEYISVQSGTLKVLPLPKPQIPPNSTPTWHFKSWHMPYVGTDMWRRELEYPEHIPTHLGQAYRRPLCIMSPQVYHRHLTFRFMKNITITICPFMFTMGTSIQKLVVDFYRLCLSVRNSVERDKVHLMYLLEPMPPKIEIEWMDGTKYYPPLISGMRVTDVIHLIMEQSFLTGDRLAAQHIAVPENPYIDPYKWDVILQYRLSRQTLLKIAQEKAASKEAT